MGTWGAGNFDNDTALDWVFELEASDDLSLVEQTIDNLLQEEYIESYQAEEALVAIEVLARLQGSFGENEEYAEDVNNWVKQHPQEVPQILKEKAKKALKIILSDNSELKELWSETQDYKAWEKEVLELNDRV
ncbi:MAG: hypothetical protein KU38_10745 [Sulfurovum sp. FS08-3]|nr:MAG: hypothetical protein KU38_10745 [Sulfurovum sp. FS08-3]